MPAIAIECFSILMQRLPLSHETGEAKAWWTARVNSFGSRRKSLQVIERAGIVASAFRLHWSTRIENQVANSGGWMGRRLVFLSAALLTLLPVRAVGARHPF